MNRILIIPILFTLTACAKTGYLLYLGVADTAVAAGAMSPCLLYILLLVLMGKGKRWAFFVMGTLVAVSGALQTVGGVFGVWDQLGLRIASTLLGVLFAIGGGLTIKHAPAKRQA